MADDTPFDPDFVPRVLAGEPTPTMPFAPPRDAKEAFAVRDEETANWVVRKVVEARAHVERVKRYARQELKRARRQERFFLQQYGPQLAAWAARQIAGNGGRLKQVRLPAGAIGFRVAGAKLSVADEQRLLEWCRVHLPDAIARTERVDKPRVNEHVRNTGECPDGADIVPPGDRFYIR